MSMAGIVCLAAGGALGAQSLAAGDRQTPAAQAPVTAPATTQAPTTPPATPPSTTQPPAPAQPAPAPAGKPATQPASPTTGTQKPAAVPTQDTPLPAGYVIGPDDVLTISYWRNPDMSAEATVRPDGLISLPLLNEVQAGGLTPEQLREKISKEAMKFLEEAPTVAVVVKAINSRKVYITGMVLKPAPYQLTGAMTVVQLLAMAGGVQEFADAKNILIVRNEGGRQVSFRFNYKDFVKGRNLKQNIELRPGDTIVVP
jgi:polysaccharide export outer membrane protein